MKHRNKYFVGYIQGILSIILNILLFIIKYWVGIQTASVAIIAEAWHTISDSFTSIIVILGFKISSKPADTKHPFGHGRAEIIGAVIIGTILATVGLNFLVQSIKRFINHQPALYNITALIVFIASIVIKEGIAQFSFWAGKKLRSKALIADGWHHRSDAIASAILVVGIILGRYFWWIDSVLGICVSLLIFYVALKLLTDSVNSLIGEEPNEEMKTRVTRIVNRMVQQNVRVHHIHLHNYGRHQELTFHIMLPADMNLYEAHCIADNLEKVIKTEMKLETTIHVEPLKESL